MCHIVTNTRFNNRFVSSAEPYPCHKYREVAYLVGTYGTLGFSDIGQGILGISSNLGLYLLGSALLAFRGFRFTPPLPFCSLFSSRFLFLLSFSPFSLGLSPSHGEIF